MHAAQNAFVNNVVHDAVRDVVNDIVVDVVGVSWPTAHAVEAFGSGIVCFLFERLSVDLTARNPN